MNSTITTTHPFIESTNTSMTSAEENFFFVTSLSLTSKHNKFDDVSPVTLSAEWSRMARLLLISCLAVIGSIGNVFMISSVMIEDHLKKAGKFVFCFCKNTKNSIIVYIFFFFLI